MGSTGSASDHRKTLVWHHWRQAGNATLQNAMLAVLSFFVSRFPFEAPRKKQAEHEEVCHGVPSLGQAEGVNRKSCSLMPDGKQLQLPTKKAQSSTSRLPKKAGATSLSLQLETRSRCFRSSKQHRRQGSKRHSPQRQHQLSRCRSRQARSENASVGSTMII